MLLSDGEIRDLCTGPFQSEPMIDPFAEGTSGNGIVSYGLSAAGYDLRLGGCILVFKNSLALVSDPRLFTDPEYHKKMFDEFAFKCGDAIVIPSGSYILAHSLEYLRIPRNLKGRCVGKSTLARVGILINTTPLEPGWQGHLTIEIGNVSPCPARIRVGEGIAQLEFELLSKPPLKDYSQRGAKYQGQRGVNPARVL